MVHHDDQTDNSSLSLVSPQQRNKLLRVTAELVKSRATYSSEIREASQATAIHEIPRIAEDQIACLYLKLEFFARFVRNEMGWQFGQDRNRGCDNRLSENRSGFDPWNAIKTKDLRASELHSIAQRASRAPDRPDPEPCRP
jgi:hypothetical protein